MKRICALLLALCLLPLCAFAQGDTPDAARAFMVQKALLLTQKMAECARDEAYLKLYATSDEMLDYAGKCAAADYAKPISAELISFDAAAETILAKTAPQTTLSGAAMERVTASLPSMFSMQVIAASGTVALAATSVLQRTDAFIAPEGMPKSALLILHFDGEFDAAAAITTNAEPVSIFSVHFMPATEDFAKRFIDVLPSAQLNDLFHIEHLSADVLSTLLGD